VVPPSAHDYCSGAKHHGVPRQREKRLLIFDTAQYRYQKFISDLASMDIHGHGAEPETALIETRRIRSKLTDIHIMDILYT
jgi:hypothetical protein